MRLWSPRLFSRALKLQEYEYVYVGLLIIELITDGTGD